MNACPQTIELQEFLIGIGECTQFDFIESHLSTCECCLSKIGELPCGSDPISDAFQTETQLNDVISSETFSRISEFVCTNISQIESSDLHPNQPIEIGSKFGDFEIQELIGQGGMGQVFRAVEKSLDRTVALKFIGELTSSHIDKKRFELEAKAMAKLEFESIVPIYQYGEIDGKCFISMKHMTGKTLRNELATRGSLHKKEAIDVAIQICRGLQQVHALEISHRDIKPSNIFIETDGNIRLFDFGLAAQRGENSNLTGKFQVIGTPKSMAPEQFLGNASKVSDIYGVGLILYEALTGKHPYSGISHKQIYEQVHKRSPAAPKELNPEIDLALSDYVMKLIAKDPNLRPQNAETVIKDLTRISDLGDSNSETGRNDRFRWILLGACLLIGAIGWVWIQLVLNVKLGSETVQIRFQNASQPIQLDVSKSDTIRLEDPIDKSVVVVRVDAKKKTLVATKNGFKVETKSFLTSLSDGSEIAFNFRPALKKTTGRSEVSKKAKPERLDLLQTPFDAANVQKVFAEKLKVSKTISNSIGIDLVLIPPGKFMRGTSPKQVTQFSEKYQGHLRKRGQNYYHQVTISSPFYLSTTELTQKQFGKIVVSYEVEESEHPLVSVSWVEAIQFCNALSKREGLAFCYTKKDSDWILDISRDGYRLPTEAEWEYAARGGTTTQFYWGDKINNDHVWYFGTSDYKSHPVGQKKPNPFGLYDMLGNVWEWVEDWFSNNYFKTSPTQNPKGPPSGRFKVKRGGSQANLVSHIKSHTRYRAPVDKRHYINGFRIAFSVTKEDLPQ